MSPQKFDLHFWWGSFTFSWLLVQSAVALDTDGILLLSFKYSILRDPLGVLDGWNYSDRSPCSWNGVTCGTESPGMGNVTGLSLPECQLLGSIPDDLGIIPYLRDLNLSSNSINGSIPLSLFQASTLQTLDLSNNLITGELPEVVGGLINLQLLNLSDNVLAGKIPENLTILGSLKVISLRNNYFSGVLPSGFSSVEVLDLSSNQINGSLPSNFTGNNLQYFNVSCNSLSGEIRQEFANQIPADAVIDLSFNNFTGEIPETALFVAQGAKSYAGNPELCGQPLNNNPCLIPSSISSPPNASAPTSPLAIAVIPKATGSSPTTTSPETASAQKGLREGTIIWIVVGDTLGGVALLALIFLFVYMFRGKKKGRATNTRRSKPSEDFDWSYSASPEESKGSRAWDCLRKQSKDDEESSEITNSDVEEGQNRDENQAQKEKKGGALVTVDGEKELELETLLKASAYIMGATGSSIIYKAVLEDGTVLAVRRIGEGGVERFRDFENQVRVIAKLTHPNLVRIRGFYWGTDEKLVIYDFVPNGSLANARCRKVGSSPCHLPWEVRLKIAKGVARGLTYIHEKKQVHGNLKPSNILLDSDMEPKIGDFGVERLVTGESGYKVIGSVRNFGSNRSMASRDSFLDNSIGATPSPSPSSMGGCISPYYAPESLRSLKPSPKWDVYSFGVVLLELLTGKVVLSDELGPGTSLVVGEDTGRVLRTADVAIRADLEGKEDALLALFRLGFSCISQLPQKRPPMKDVVQALEKFPCSSCPLAFDCGH